MNREFDAAFTPLEKGFTVIEASAGTGKIVSTASVSLAGTLNAANATSFTPTAGTVYTVLQGTSVTGTCAGSIGTYTLGVGSTTVTLTA